MADAIPATLRRLVEFLNEHLDTVEVLAVELPQYVASDTQLRAVVPRLVGQTERARAVKGMPARDTRSWDEESFLADVEAWKGSDGLAIAQEFLAWGQGHVDHIWWGSGKADGSVIMGARGVDGEQAFFTVWSFGRVEVNFQYLKNRVPFRDESLRQTLLDKLNGLPQVEIANDKLTKRPSISFDLLRDPETLHGFLAAMEWVVTTIQQAE